MCAAEASVKQDTVLDRRFVSLALAWTGQPHQPALVQRYHMQYHSLMGRAEKILQQMQNNPRDWRIESLKTVASAFDIAWRQRGTSHVVFVRSDGRTLPVPARRPIKPIYIRKFVEFVLE